MVVLPGSGAQRRRVMDKFIEDSFIVHCTTNVNSYCALQKRLFASYSERSSLGTHRTAKAQCIIVAKQHGSTLRTPKPCGSVWSFAYIVGRAQMKFEITLRNRSGPRQLLKCTAAILRSCEIAFPSARVTPAEIRFVFDAFGPLRNYSWLVSATGPSSIITTFVLRLVITFSRFSEDT